MKYSHTLKGGVSRDYKVLKMKEIYVDGSGWNGQVSKACILVDGQDPEIITRHDEKTNNEMEYEALFVALLELAEDGDIIYTDSQLVANQINKGWKCNHEHLRAYRDKCLEIISEKQGIIIKWIPRDQNKAGKVLER